MAHDPNVYQAPSEGAQSPALFPDDDLMPMSGAGFGIRAAARVIDTVVGLGLGLVAGFGVGLTAVALAASGSLPPGWQHRLGTLSASGVALSFLGTVLYHTVAESMGGATIGKAICGLRVRREDLSPCGFGGALIRSLAYFIDALFCALVAYMTMSNSRWQQRVGDKWGKTVVVKVTSLEERGAVNPGIGGGIAVATLLWITTLFVGNLIRLF